MFKKFFLAIFCLFFVTIHARDIRFSYDKDRLEKQTYSNGTSLRYSYQPDGKIAQIIESRGNIVAFSYDDKGNIIKSSITSPESLAYSFAYDKKNHLTRVAYPDGKWMDYLWDNQGRLIVKNFNDEYKITYEYDQQGRVVKCIDYSGSTTYEYGELTTIKRPSNVNTVLDYRPNEGYAKISYLEEATLLLEQVYKVNNRGLCKSYEKSYEDQKSLEYYSYDSLGELISIENSQSRKHEYSYDLFGNRTHEKKGGEHTEYIHDDKNQLKKMGDKSFEYDSGGNMIRWCERDRAVTFSYDDYQRLESISEGNNKIEYVYDSLGMIYKRKEDGKTTIYYRDCLDPARRAFCIKSEGEAPSYFCYDNMTCHQSQKTTVLLIDRQGTVLGAVNSKGVTYYEYDIYGKLLSDEIPILGYCGREYEGKYGLTYTICRHYCPALGRFIAADQKLGTPLKPLSLNPYIYCHNDPVNFLDWNGREEDEVVVVLGVYLPGAKVEMFNKDLEVYETHISDVGHGYVVFTYSNGKQRIFGNSPEGFLGLFGLRSGGVQEEFFKIPNESLSLSKTIPIHIAEELIIEIQSMGNKRYNCLTNNCIDFATDFYCKNIDPSFQPVVDKLGVSCPIELAHAISSLTGATIPSLEQYRQESSHLYKLHQNQTSDPLMPYNLLDVANMKHLFAHFFGCRGGIELNMAAKIACNLTDIVGATFNEQTGELIVYGKRVQTLPSVDVDDLTVAIRSVYGLSGCPPQDPGIDMKTQKITGKNSKGKPKHWFEGEVTYFGQTMDTSFGMSLFQADRRLKSLMIGEHDNNLKDLGKRWKNEGSEGFYPLIYRLLYVNKESYINWPIRIWFAPKEVMLKESPNRMQFIFDHVSVGLFSDHDHLKSVQDFKRSIETHFDHYCTLYPEFSEIKRLAKITAMAKWLYDNNIPIELSYFEKRPLKYVNTPKTFKVIEKEYSYFYNGNLHKQPFQGGVLFHLDEGNLIKISDSQVENTLNKFLATRPSDTTKEWSTSEMDCSAVPIAKTDRTGYVRRAFLDMSFTGVGKFPLELRRVFHSFTEEGHVFGKKWETTPAQLAFHGYKVGFVTRQGVQFPAYPQIVLWLDGMSYIYKPIAYENNVIIYSDELGIRKLYSINEKFELIFSTKERLLFDKLGQLLMTIDNEGHTISYEWESNRLMAIGDDQGRVIRLIYHNNQLKEVRGPGQKVLFYEFDLNQRVKAVHDTLGLLERYEYDEFSNLTAIYDGRESCIFKAEYDEYNRAKTLMDEKCSVASSYNSIQGTNQISCNEQEMVVGFNKEGHITSIATEDDIAIDYKGLLPVSFRKGNHTLNYIYDQKGRLQRVSNEKLESVTYYYAFDDSWTMIYERDHVRMAYLYDNRGSLRQKGFVETICIINNQLYALKLDESRTIKYDYDASNRITAIYKKNILIASYRYSLFGQIIEKSIFGKISQYNYDDRGRLSRIIYDGIEKILSYDDRDRLVEIRNAEELESAFAFDAYGQIEEIKDAAGGKTKIATNRYSSMTRVTFANHTFRDHYFDEAGHLIGVSD